MMMPETPVRIAETPIVEPFARSAVVLSVIGASVTPATLDDLFWEPLVESGARSLSARLRSVFDGLRRVSVARARPVDLDGQTIYLDEHDAPFILLPTGKQIYVHVYVVQEGRRDILLTAPNANPLRRYVSPQERAQRALLSLIDDEAAFFPSENIPMLDDVPGCEPGDQCRCLC